MKTALVMDRLQVDASEARERLDQAGGSIAQLIPDLGAGA